MNDSTTTNVTYEGQLAERAAELLPGLATAERLELLDAMDPDDLPVVLAAMTDNPERMAMARLLPGL